MYFVIGVLALCLLVMAFRLFQYKRQMSAFASDIRKRMEKDHNQPVSVDYFGRDVVALAEALNGYTDLQKEQLLQYERDRRYLKNLIAGISHDFRTPLTAGLGYLQMLEKSGGLDGENVEYLQIAMEKLRYLKHLSDDFFEVSTLDAKLSEAVFEQVNLNNLLSECILEQHAWIEASGLAVSFLLPEQDVLLCSNAHYLKRMVNNMFSNARKYAKSFLNMSVTMIKDDIVITMENDMEQGASLDIGQVFDAFYRGDSGSKQGSGMGLYVVKILSERLGYQVSAFMESPDPEGESAGNIFRISLTIGVQ